MCALFIGMEGISIFVAYKMLVSNVIEWIYIYPSLTFTLLSTMNIILFLNEYSVQDLLVLIVVSKLLGFSFSNASKYTENIWHYLIPVFACWICRILLSFSEKPSKITLPQYASGDALMEIQRSGCLNFEFIHTVGALTFIS